LFLQGVADAGGAVSNDATDGPTIDVECVLHGGFSNQHTTVARDTWLLTGGAWMRSRAPFLRPCQGDSAPVCTFDGALVNAGGRILFVGSTGFPADTIIATFEWTGSAWTELATMNPPPARFEPAVAALGDRVVLFGGMASGSIGEVLGDTYVLEGPTWTAVASPGPPARWLAAMAGSPRGVLLFGGADFSGSLGDTWLFDGRAWTPVTTTAAPSARGAASAVWLDDGVLLFGGCVGGGYLGCSDVGVPSDETWRFLPTAGWTELHPSRSPPPRDRATAAALSGASALLFGGFAGSMENVTLADTWIWDGDWKKGPAGPPPRAGATMACR
jgi:hypothetical protein